MQTIKDKNFEGLKVLVGVDWNVPLTKEDNPRVTDTTRIEMSKETVRFLSDQGAKVILMSHLGRPKGIVNESLSLKACINPAETIFEKKINFVEECVGDQVINAVNDMKNGDILLLENIRFHIEETDYKKKSEEAKVQEFAKDLGLGYDEFVQEAFGRCHRKAASTVGVIKEAGLPSSVGFLVNSEIENLSKLLKSDKNTFVSIIGGAKVSDKVGALKSLLDVSSKIIIGGAMAYPFLKSQGINIGKSKISEEDIPLAKEILDQAKEKNVEILLPCDHMIADAFSNNANFSVTNSASIPDDMMGLDIGPITLENYKKVLDGARTVFWNGPMGVFEFEKTAKGTFEIAKYLASLEDVFEVVGGGDSVSALNKSGHAHKVSFISSGGGASLEFIEKKGALPGLIAMGFQEIN